MKKIGPRLLWIALGLSVALALLWQLIPLPDAGRRLSAVPLNGWRLAGRDVPLTATERSIFGEARVLKRLCQVGAQRIVLVAIDGSHGRHAVHDPLYCFRGAGWTVQGDEELRVPGGVARRLSLGKNGEVAEAVYWISDGRSRHATPMRYWWQTTWRRLTLGSSGDEPVLVILQPYSAEKTNWEEVFSGFPALFDL